VTALAPALAEAGGAAAPPSATAELRRALDAALAHGRAELEKPRSGRGEPVEIAVASTDDGLRAALPVDKSFRADPEASGERTLLLVGAVVAALVDLAGEPPRPPVSAGDLLVRAGERGDDLVIAHPAVPLDPVELEELLPLAFEDRLERIDRLRARALAVPAALLDDGGQCLREPIGAGHPLRVAEAVARLGGEPSDPRSVDEHEEAVLALLTAGIPDATRPHEDPDDARRVARRILQRLDGMGKWGGYHTDFAHLARGFAGNERALAQEVGEALIASGLLDEKPSVGQRHVFLNPRRAGDIHALIERGETPRELKLPR
jgi:hypothetical protein